ncbi:Bacterial type II secretion system protein F domain protein [Gimesia panareensis]|uniref:Bacterial type II secretion system protein F domain protein n=1 Tax=Gimesia panareensis TaxID=2527978 RepID=A0A517Q2J1_9PLAN|nr:type II secretion system F family protein [Gimesia panareensis]QDT25846.1 Bacterial type II secretion system protein F domain protein [Gimesia panareensis]
MFTPTTITIFYALCGAIILWMLVRIIRKRRNNQSVEQQPEEVVATPEKESYSPSAASTSTTPATWEHRQLFRTDSKELEGAEQNLPHIEAGEVPSMGTDDYVFGSATPALSEMMPESEGRRAQTKKELQAAGYYQPHALQNFSAIRYVSILGTLLFFGVLLIISPERFEIPILLGMLLVPILVWAVPFLFVSGQASDRRSEIEQGIPDMLDMLNMCVSQGMTVPHALKKIIGELGKVYPALAQELKIVMEQASIGTFTQALSNFSKRIDVPEVHSFSALLIQTDQMGTDVTSALQEYSDNMRESLQQRADEKANKATFKLLFPTVFCLMPAIYIFLLGPAIVELSDFFHSGGRDSLNSTTDLFQQVGTQQ